MGRQLAAKRERLKELQRAGHRPNVKSVKEKDVAALGKLRELRQGDVGVTAHVLKALVDDVVIQKQHVDGYENPQMVARFTISAVPALAVLDRGGPGHSHLCRGTPGQVAPGRASRDGRVSKTENLQHVFWTCRSRRHILTKCRKNPVSATLLNGQRGGRTCRTTICRSSRRLLTWKLGRF